MFNSDQYEISEQDRQYRVETLTFALLMHVVCKLRSI